MSVFASGKYAQAICDRHGGVVPYRTLVREPITNLMVCPRCLDKKVRNEPITPGPERIAIRNARPQEKTYVTADTSLIPANTTYTFANS